MIAQHRTSRLARGQRRSTRLALAAVGGCVATAALLAGMAVLSERLATTPPQPLPPLATLDRPPPPQPPPTQPMMPPQPEPAPPRLPTLPPLDLALPTRTETIALPPSALAIDAIALGPAIAIPEITVPAPDPGPPSRARGARRLIVPDLERFYPREAERRGIEGRTTVRVAIDRDGRVTAVEVVASEPPGTFDRAARRAMTRVRYDPATDAAGEPVPGTAEETLVWTLER